MRDPYEVLNVGRGATPSQIRDAYKRLARLYHPDLHAHESEAVRDAAHERMAEVNAAFQLLNDPEKLARFEKLHPPSPSPTAGGASFRQGRRPDPAAPRDDNRPGTTSRGGDFDYRQRARAEFDVARRSYAAWSATTDGPARPARTATDDWLTRARTDLRRTLERLRAWFRGEA